MYRLVVSDMDDTFLGHGHRMIPANVEALRRMRELGILFVASSGRPYGTIMNDLAKIPAEILEGSYVISYNGAVINRVGDPVPLTGTALDRPVAEAIWAHGRSLGLCMHAYTLEGGWYVANTNADEAAWLAGFEGVIEHIGPAPETLDFLGGAQVAKLIFESADFAYIQRLGAEFGGSLDRSLVDYTFSSRRYVEFVPAGVNKGTGLVQLAGIMGIDLAETVAVGDAANDLAMIRAAGLGVGVANVTPDVAPFCDVVLATAGCDGAFPELLERYLEPAARS